MKTSKQVTQIGKIKTKHFSKVDNNYYSPPLVESTTIRSDEIYAKDRIRSARLKLNGINPFVITAYVVYS